MALPNENQQIAQLIVELTAERIGREVEAAHHIVGAMTELAVRVERATEIAEMVERRIARRLLVRRKYGR